MHHLAVGVLCSTACSALSVAGAELWRCLLNSLLLVLSGYGDIGTRRPDLHVGIAGAAWG